MKRRYELPPSKHQLNVIEPERASTRARHGTHRRLLGSGRPQADPKTTRNAQGDADADASCQTVADPASTSDAGTDPSPKPVDSL